MNKMMMNLPSSFRKAVRQVFVGGPRVTSPDLQNLSDRCLLDIGLIRSRIDFEASKHSWLAY
jgi:hypothetical protein